VQIYQYIAKTDIPTMQKIIKEYGFNPNKPIKQHKEEDLSDREIRDLMKHDSYKRTHGAIRQTRWG